MVLNLVISDKDGLNMVWIGLVFKLFVIGRISVLIKFCLVKVIFMFVNVFLIVI